MTNSPAQNTDLLTDITLLNVVRNLSEVFELQILLQRQLIGAIKAGNKLNQLKIERKLKDNEARFSVLMDEGLSFTDNVQEELDAW